MKKESQKTKGKEIRDQYTIVLEEFRGNFKAFGESLNFVRKDVGELNKKVDHMDMRLERVEGDMTLLKTDVSHLKKDMIQVKSEVTSIRQNQINNNEFKLLDSRVLRLEKTSTHH